ncbi:hypothetical protein [Telmatospirillum sp. J64-1]|uniref:hypothetical protein n=1 Tax=Telmatospirillum sp. J64-1 TaxID=2502183 RepID=UPI00115E15EB|nr:hypothetical protein [Telmatospirillum sp. J64-1]
MMRKQLRACLLLTLPLSLAGCGIPDAVAHLTKVTQEQHNASRERSGAPAANAAPAAAQPAPASYAPEPPPPAAPVTVQRESIMVEDLPPQ